MENNNNEEVLKDELVTEEVKETVEKEEIIDTKETVEEVANNDVISSTEEILKGDSLLLEEADKEDSKAMKFIKKLVASAVDQIIVIAVALLLLVVFDFVLKLVGFYVAERQPVFLIMYVLVNIVYEAICSSTKLKTTIGKKTII